MIIDCISDLHGFYPELQGGDLLIVSGDLTASHTIRELDYFNDWIREQPYDKKILIGGNHDTFFEQGVFNIDDPRDGTVFVDPSVDYLCDSGLEYMGLKIWGSPWTLAFEGMNPKCKAFTVDAEEELAEKWALIPDDIDILVTHSPPWGILDLVDKISLGKNNDHKFKGSRSLRQKSMSIMPKLHVFGHIHECGGNQIDLVMTRFVNASIMNEKYQPVNKPVRIIL